MEQQWWLYLFVAFLVIDTSKTTALSFEGNEIP